MKNMIFISIILIGVQVMNVQANLPILKSRTGDSVCLNQHGNPVFVSSGTLCHKEGRVFVKHKFDEQGRQRKEITNYSQYYEHRTMKYYGFQKYKRLKHYLGKLNDHTHLVWKKLNS